MGNDQSRQSAGDGAEPSPVDYYELLQVSEDATPEDIKRSYRKLALLTHPDKCPPEKAIEATKMFADLQQAYEILMDPNERAFYDSHRNLPSGAVDNDLYEHVRSSDVQRTSKFAGPGKPGVRMEQLLRFFDPKLARKMDDSPEGFYSVYRSLFELIATDERENATAAGHGQWEYPSFGDSSTVYAPLPGITRAERTTQLWVRDFYSVWAEFVTVKSFEWVKKWDLDKGTDRSMRRLMEKENRKLREEYKRDYNHTIKQLVSFLQARDPRYKEYRSSSARRKEARDAPDRPRRTEDGPSREDIRQQAAAEFEEQDWQKINDIPLSSEEDEDQVDAQQLLECVACGKTFASDATWMNHERSKRHKQAVLKLRRQMEDEAHELGLLDQSGEHDAAELNSSTHLSGVSSGDSGLNISHKENYDGHMTAETEFLAAPPGRSDSTWNFDASSSATTMKPKDQVDQSQKEVDFDGSSSATTMQPKDQVDQSQEKVEKGSEGKRGRKGGSVRSSDKTDTHSGSKSRQQHSAASQPGKQSIKPSNPKQRSKVLPLSSEATEQKFQIIINEIETKRVKLTEKWGDSWASKSYVMLKAAVGSSPQILCLGLGKPASDRTAQIQLALLLVLASRIAAFDPVWDDLDKRVLTYFQVPQIEENLDGKHVLDDDQSYLLYMPHCPKSLYQNILATNFGPRLTQVGRVLLGNSLTEYVEEIGPKNAATQEDAFQKPKKKRPSRPNPVPKTRKDGVLERIVPHLETLSLSEMPDTHLTGFARAFLSLSFQWLDKDKHDSLDWSSLPSPKGESET
ncbi:hypothetical protein BD324DRAFT_645995 [Kockovaella imperatae]|uniref:J domain-containing protein n=1 Tax=Kockovaella imperatae TaxID=4999 RepID=A0A1Y1UFX9_9TREE|nr:hypothetical protein BD324DRAFT_645995 [Kockovaella imperatae]ORX36437.1 hypothetical protein BD324DRAFT_645995 [Kockovaella imperatae]